MSRSAAPLMLAALMLAALGLPAVAAVTDNVASSPSNDPFGALAARQRQLALDAEGKDDPLRAVAHWQYVLATNPRDATAKAKVESLKKQAHDRAEQLFKDGFAQFERNTMQSRFQALKLLLKGLGYDPTNREAVRIVKELQGKSVNEYRVQAGDTLASIASNNADQGYNDPKFAVVIADYNGLKPGQPLKNGQVLKLPVMAGVMPQAAPVVVASRRRTAAQQQADAEAQAESADEVDTAKANDQAADAAALLKSNKFEDAISLANKVLEDDPLNKDAKDVRNAANMGLGQQLFDAKNFKAALEVYQRVDPAFPNQKERLAAVRAQIPDPAEVAYQEGVDYYTKDDLDNAIKSFQAALKLNPNHSAAKRDLQQVIETRDKLQKLK